MRRIPAYLSGVLAEHLCGGIRWPPKLAVQPGAPMSISSGSKLLDPYNIPTGVWSRFLGGANTSRNLDEAAAFLCWR